jgi:translation elongation factor P/translation initiation factor 5A
VNTNFLKFSVLVLLSASLLTVVSCSSTDGKVTDEAKYEKGVPGGVYVQTYETTATVTAIDPATRKVTLRRENGNEATYTAPGEMVNFDQLRVGDRIKAVVTGKAVVFMATDAAPQGEGSATIVVLPAEGSKPGALVADTVQIKAKVTAIDLKKRKATLQFPDGHTETFEVRKDVDLTKRKVGEEVVIRATQAVLVGVQKQ